MSTGVVVGVFGLWRAGVVQVGGSCWWVDRGGQWVSLVAYMQLDGHNTSALHVESPPRASRGRLAYVI